jgi:citrate lyase beta subunit
MDAVVAYHFLPARKPAVIRRLLAQLPARNVLAMLDLEDSAADVLVPERTAELKATARANLAAFFAAGGVPADRLLGVRVNAAGTPDHAADPGSMPAAAGFVPRADGPPHAEPGADAGGGGRGWGRGRRRRGRGVAT